MEQSEPEKPLLQRTTSVPTRHHQWIQKQQLDVEEAETANIAYLDKAKTTHRRRKLTWDEMKDPFSDVGHQQHRTTERIPRFERREMMIKLVSVGRLGKRHIISKDSNIPAEQILKTIESPPIPKTNRYHPLFQSVGLDDGETTSEDDECDDENNVVIGSTSKDSENTELPLISQASSYGSVQRLRQGNIGKNQKKVTQYWFTKYYQALVHCDWKKICQFTFQKFIYSFFCLIAMPMVIISLFFYYVLGNPVVPIFHDAFGKKVTISWWLNFLGRQIVTFELSRIAQWLALDCFVSGKRSVASKLLGPHLTLIALQSRGFPFILTAWAMLDMVLLRGTSNFHVHWLYWTSWKIYSQGNSGSFILSSTVYFRLLCSMIIIGWANTIKRSAFTIQFGKRLLATFKPQLEVLLADIVLMNEIAILADQVESAVDDYEHVPKPGLRKKDEVSEVQGTEGNKIVDTLQGSQTISRADSGVREEKILWSNVDMIKPGMVARGESTAMNDDSSDNTRQQRARRVSQFDAVQETPSRCLALKGLLDRWEDPVEALGNKTQNATIQDVLKFERALGYMDESHPFGDAFGPARDRDEALESAHAIYWKLTILDDTDASDVVSFDILALIANDENGKPIPAKLNKLKKLFRPDSRNELPLLAFIQSCDNVYKSLRYFRASVSNSSAIDQVLQSMVDAIFWFVLSMIVLEVMNFDPWTIVLSSMSLLVSVSFALGPSVSQFVEGLLLIAARRPFDLGDRIIMIGSESQDKPSPSESYFVEDISLLKTTVRYAKTNEVSSISNFSISKSRIINLQRSLNAIIYVEMKFKIKVMFCDENNAKYRSILEHYVQENTRLWECLAFMRPDEFDPDVGFVIYRFGFRHRGSWQNAARIMLHRSDLLRFMYEQGDKLNIHFQTPIPRRCILDGGILENDEVRPKKEWWGTSTSHEQYGLLR